MSEKTYLICDCVGSAELQVLTESTNGNQSYVIRGKFQEADSKNRNNRIYPRSVLDPQVQALQMVIEQQGGILGELDHPADSVIHYENTSHIVTKLWWENNTLMGEARILNTPSGMILKSLIQEGINPGISSRGVGSGKMNREGLTVINDGFRLITFDAVADPSTYGAFLSVKESETPMPISIPNTTENTENHTNNATNRIDSTKLDPIVVEGYLKAMFEKMKSDF